MALKEESAGSLDHIVTFVEQEMLKSIRLKQAFLNSGASLVAQIGNAVLTCFKRGGKLLLFGNGGSAADAQHIAAEFVGRYQLDRRALPAMALSVNSSTVTAVANDYGYE